jgi:hypothetical protein
VITETINTTETAPEIKRETVSGIGTEGVTAAVTVDANTTGTESEAIETRTSGTTGTEIGRRNTMIMMTRMMVKWRRQGMMTVVGTSRVPEASARIEIIVNAVESMTMLTRSSSTGIAINTNGLIAIMTGMIRWQRTTMITVMIELLLLTRIGNTGNLTGQLPVVVTSSSEGVFSSHLFQSLNMFCLSD